MNEISVFTRYINIELEGAHTRSWIMWNYGDWDLQMHNKIISCENKTQIKWIAFAMLNFSEYMFCMLVNYVNVINLKLYNCFRYHR